MLKRQIHVYVCVKTDKKASMPSEIQIQIIIKHFEHDVVKMWKKI